MPYDLPIAQETFKVNKREVRNAVWAIVTSYGISYLSFIDFKCLLGDR
jgi:hypothetical protein